MLTFPGMCENFWRFPIRTCSDHVQKFWVKIIGGLSIVEVGCTSLLTLESSAGFVES